MSIQKYNVSYIFTIGFWIALLSVSICSVVLSSLALSFDDQVPTSSVTPADQRTLSGSVVINQPVDNNYPTVPLTVTFDPSFLSPPASIFTTSRDELMSQVCPSALTNLTAVGFDVSVLSCPEIGYTLPNSSASSSGTDFFQVLPVGTLIGVGYRSGVNYLYQLGNNVIGTSFENPVTVYTMQGANTGNDLFLVSGTPALLTFDNVTEIRYVRSLNNNNNFSTVTSYGLPTLNPSNPSYLSSTLLASNNVSYVYGDSTTADIVFRQSSVNVPETALDWSLQYAVPSTDDPSGGLSMTLVGVPNENVPGFCFGDQSSNLRYQVAATPNPVSGLDWLLVSVTVVADDGNNWSVAGSRMQLVNINVGSELRPMIVWLNDNGSNLHFYFIIAEDNNGTVWPGESGRIALDPDVTENQSGIAAVRLSDGTVGITWTSGNPGRQRYARIDGNDPTNFQVVTLGNGNRTGTLGLGLISDSPATVFNVEGVSTCSYVRANGGNLDFSNNVNFTFAATGLVS